MPDATVIDTSVFIHDPDVLDYLLKNEQIPCTPWTVILELDKLKDRPDIGIDARESMAKIESMRQGGEDLIKIIRNYSFRNLPDLDRKIPDHQIIATAKTLQETKSRLRKFNYGEVRLISRDRTVRVLAREVGLRADDYCREKIQLPKKHFLEEINVPRKDIDPETLSFSYKDEQIEENQGVVCYSDFNFAMPHSRSSEWKKTFASIRKGENFKIIPPGIQAFGVKPFLLNGNGNGNGSEKGEKNWAQYIALFQLLDPSIDLVFLQGGAGSGKTLLAVASAIEQRRSFRQIIITRPMIHLEDEDRMGFLPGSEEQKMSPWTRPIMQAMDYLKENSGEGGKELIEKLFDTKKISFESLDYIRGMTYCKTFLVVDEAQNLTPHQVKTIITRAGIGTKIVFTGDLGQIDRRRRLDERSNGLAYAMSTMKNHERVGIATFKETVRSPLAQLAEERM